MKHVSKTVPVHFADIDIQFLAQRYPTPFYLYSWSAVESAYQNIVNKMPANALVAYAVKACSNIAILQGMDRLGAYFEVVSMGEYMRLKKAHVSPKKIIAGGLGKDIEYIELLMRENLFAIHIESLEELHIMLANSHKCRETIQIGLRINPEATVDSHPYLQTATRNSKFGLNMKEYAEAIQLIKSQQHLSLRGISFHIGSNISSDIPYREAIQTTKRFLEEHRVLSEIAYIDIGGGFSTEVAQYFEKIVKEFKSNFMDSIAMVVEPGRSLIAEAGILLTRVLAIKQRGKSLCIIDASMTEFIRPALYQVTHPIVPIEMRMGKTQPMDVVGPICESGDQFAKNCVLNVRIGDLLGVLNVGAYGLSMASNYNTRRRPAELLAVGEEIHEIRSRERWDDLWQNEFLIPDWC